MNENKNSKKKPLSKGAKVGISLGCVIPVLAGAAVGVAYMVISKSPVRPTTTTVKSDEHHVATFNFTFKEKIDDNLVKAEIDDRTGLKMRFNVGSNATFIIGKDNKLDIEFVQDSLWTQNGKSDFSIVFTYFVKEEEKQYRVDNLQIQWVNFSEHVVTFGGQTDISRIERQAGTSDEIEHDFKIILDGSDVTDDKTVSFEISGPNKDVVSIDKQKIYYSACDACEKTFSIVANIDGHISPNSLDGKFVFYGTVVKGGMLQIDATASIPGTDTTNPWKLYKVDKDGKEIAFPIENVKYRLDAEQGRPSLPDDFKINKNGFLQWYDSSKPYHVVTPGTYEFTIHATSEDGYFNADSNPVYVTIAKPEHDMPTHIDVQAGRGDSTQTPIGHLIIDGKNVEDVTYTSTDAESCGVHINPTNGTYYWDENAEGTFHVTISKGMYQVTSKPINIVQHEITIESNKTLLDWGLDNENGAYFDLKDDGKIINATFMNDGDLPFIWTNNHLTWNDSLVIDDGDTKFHVTGTSIDTIPTYVATTDEITIRKQVVDLDGEFNVEGLATDKKALNPLTFTLDGEATTDVIYTVDPKSQKDINLISVDSDGYITWENTLTEGKHYFTITATKGLYTISKQGTINIVKAEVTGPDDIYVQQGISGSSTTPFKLFVEGKEITTLDDLDYSPKISGLTINTYTGLMSWNTSLVTSQSTILTITAKGKTQYGRQYTWTKNCNLNIVNPTIEGPTNLTFSEGQTDINPLNYKYKLMINGEAQICEIDNDETHLQSESLQLTPDADGKSYQLKTIYGMSIKAADFTENEISVGLIVTEGVYKGMKATITNSVNFIDTSISGVEKLYAQVNVLEGEFAEDIYGCVYNLSVGGETKKFNECSHDFSYDISGFVWSFNDNGDGIIKWYAQNMIKPATETTLTVWEKSTGYSASKKLIFEACKFEAGSSSKSLIGYKGVNGSYSNFKTLFNEVEITPSAQDILTYTVNKDSLSDANKNEIKFEKIDGKNVLTWTENAISEDDFSIDVVYYCANHNRNYTAKINHMQLSIEQVSIQEQDGQNEFDIGGINSQVGRFHFMAGTKKLDNNVNWDVNNQNFAMVSMGSYMTLENKSNDIGTQDINLTISAIDKDSGVTLAQYDVLVHPHSFIIDEVDILADNSSDLNLPIVARLDGEPYTKLISWGYSYNGTDKDHIKLNMNNLHIDAGYTFNLSRSSAEPFKITAQVYDGGFTCKYYAEIYCKIVFAAATFTGGSTELILTDGSVTDVNPWMLKIGDITSPAVQFSAVEQTGGMIDATISFVDGVIKITNGGAGTFKIKAQYDSDGDGLVDREIISDIVITVTE